MRDEIYTRNEALRESEGERTPICFKEEIIEDDPNTIYDEKLKK